MEKTEMMKRYESETGKQSAIVKFMAGGQAFESKDFPKIGPYEYSTDYIAWLEAKANISDEAIKAFQKLIRTQCDEISALKEKAAAYERLMSGGLSMKELANILKHPVAIENDEGQNTLYYFGSIPHLGQFSDGTQFWSCKRKWRLPRQLVHFTGSWQDSITIPDGWEEE